MVAARRVAQRLGPGKTVVTLLCDSGLKYLNTDVYRRGSDPGEAGPPRPGLRKDRRHWDRRTSDPGRPVALASRSWTS